MAATSEAVVMGVKAGLDPAVMIDVINAGTGRNSASQDKFPRAILPRTFEYGFTNGLMDKDLQLCLEEAEALGLKLPVASAVRDMYRLAASELGPEKDFTTIIQPIEKRAGVVVRGKERELTWPTISTKSTRSATGTTSGVRSENFIGGDPHDHLSAINYFIWVIKGAHGNFVVDTGMDEAMATKRGRRVDKPIAEGLRALGIAPDTIAKAIVTHLHFDHAGNYDLFPRALSHAGHGDGLCHRPLHVPRATALAVRGRRRGCDGAKKVFAGRVEFHDGDDELAPGITLHKIGGHSMGLQCVRVKTRRGYVVLASDATHLYQHIEEGRIFPVVHNAADVLEGYKTIKRLAASPLHVIPGHDPKVLERFPAARGGLEGWVVRLDADPC